MINILAVRENAMPVTTQADTWKDAARLVIDWVDRPIFNYVAPIARVFMSDGKTGLEEHRISDLRKALKAGTIPGRRKR